MLKHILPSLSFLLLMACGEEEYVPKPRGYFQIYMPEKEYTNFNNPGYLFTSKYRSFR